jgi:murein DD-endopeptidase MepM/ murein hydrolase activator NlpD
MAERKKVHENLRALAMAALAAISLAACSTSPRTQLSWDVRDHAIQSHRGVVEYGPRTVKLPPVQQHRFVAPTQDPNARYAIVPTPKPGAKRPTWWTQTQTAQAAPQPASRDVVVQPDRVADASMQFRWPLAGRVISDFGASGTGERNDGINISAQQGAPVRASASGTVSYCGNELKGYGNLVLIRHDDGYITAYAHVASFIVNRDDHVLAGQVIAYAGTTGDVSSPQLHFEIRQGVRALDPKSLLPKPLIVASN